MAHTFTADLGTGDLHAALVTDLVLVLELDPLIFSAVTFPVLGRSEDAFAVQTVADEADIKSFFSGDDDEDSIF